MAENTSTRQTKYLLLAETALDNNDLNRALSAFGLIKRWDSTSVMGQSAGKKIDSLKKTERSRILGEIQGVWKWEVTGSNWGVGSSAATNNANRYIEISDNEMKVYEIDSTSLEKNMIQEEKLHFSNISDWFPFYLDFKYTTGEFWRYRLKDNGQTLHTMHTGNLTENSRNVIDCGNQEIEYKKVL